MSAQRPPTTLLGESELFAFSESMLTYIQSHRWAQNAYQAVSFSVPNNWQAGRIWVSDMLCRSVFTHEFPSRLGVTVTLA